MIRTSLSSRDLLPAGTELVLSFRDDPTSQHTYVLENVLAQGGFSVAYLAHRKDTLSKKVVLKELYPDPSPLETVHLTRNEEGTLIATRLFTREEDPSFLAPYIDAFEREARIAQRAGMVFFDRTNQSYYSSADTLEVRLCTGSNGNYYLFSETYPGIPLDTLIHSGWESLDQRGLVRNANLTWIFQVLEDISYSVDRLHRQNLLHLDIHPGNIYLIERGTKLLPYLIDYGNAVELDDQGYPPQGHPYSVNRLSAPELIPLSQYHGDLASGYIPSEGTDTYSIAAILFYSVTGRYPEKEFGNRKSWEAILDRLFPAPIYGTFSDQLKRFFADALSPWQEDRLSADEMYRALVRLDSAFHVPGGLLQAMDAPSLGAAQLLHEYPLFEAPSEDDGIRLLCIGTGDLADAVIRLGFSCQLLDQPLYITVAAADAEAYRDSLLERAPSLPRFSNLSDNPEAVYASFQFLSTTCPEEIVSKCSDFRYVVIDLGSSERNLTYGKELLSKWPSDSAPAIIHYAQSESLSRTMPLNLPVRLRKQLGLDDIRFHPFGHIGTQASVFHVLLETRALDIHLAYSNPDNDPARRDEEIKGFIRSPYNTASSALAALHIPYKLHSLKRLRGKTSVQDPADLFRSALSDTEIKNALMYLEHCRWNCEKIMDGYQRPDRDTILTYAYQGSNRKSHSETLKLHPCLVESHRTSGIHLTPDDFLGAPYPSPDPLDQVSLMVHAVAGELKQQQDRILPIYLQIIEGKAGQLPALLNALKKDVAAIQSGNIPKMQPRNYSSLFQAEFVSVETELAGIEENLLAARSFHQQIDYKCFDLDILKIIPKILSASL